MGWPLELGRVELEGEPTEVVTTGSQKAPWAYSKGKGKTKHKGKSKQDRWGGSYVRGGYMDPDGQFYKHLDDFIGISLDFLIMFLTFMMWW